MPTSQANRQPKRRGDRSGGFSMMEVVLALVILGLLAALGLPFIRPNSGMTALRTKAFDIVALLRNERNAALRHGVAGSVVVDVQGRQVRAERARGAVVLPASMSLRIQPEAAAGFLFTPDGRASGGRLSVMGGNSAVDIDVNSVTAAISVSDTPHDRR